MAIPTVRKAAEKYYNAYLADLSTASISFVAMAGRGRLVKLHAVTGIAITGGDNTVTVKINGTTTSQTLVCTLSGAAIGKLYTLTFTGNLQVDDGDVISFDSDGAGTAVVPTYFTLVVDES
jgi:hypothetical protein